MRWGLPVPGLYGRATAILLFALVSAGFPSTAAAQTSTTVLNVPGTEVVDTMIRNGPYAAINQDGPLLLTRFSDVPEWERRTIIAIDTTRIAERSPVTSASLTLTVKSGLGTAGSTRPVTVYRLTSAFVEQEATWNNRQSGAPWQTPGGDLGEPHGTVEVTNTVLARVNFNITALVQQAVNNELGTRVVRLALVDVGGGGNIKESFREYHSSEASTAANRPQLAVVHGSVTPPSTIDVPAGGNLQLALNQVPRGGTVRLASGAVYVGNFVLPAKSGTGTVTLTTNTTDLPSPGNRIGPGDRPPLAILRSPDGYPALATAAAASHYRIVGVGFSANVDGAGDVIALGSSSQTTLAQVPHHLELDRVLVQGDASVGQKRGVSVNATHVLIQNSDIRGIKAVGQDSQAIAGWNTPGPITIRNNYLEAAGENIMFGGAHATLPSVVPSDILVEGNLLAKDLLWRGSSWTVKNIFELKNARRVVVRGNTLEYNWSAAQAGYAVVLTPRNSSGQNPWAVVEDVEISGNVIRHSGSAFNLLGHDDTAISGQLARIVIRDNLVYDISGSVWGGAGVFAQIGGEPREITIDHNTVLHTGNVVSFYSGSYPNSAGVRVAGGPTAGFVFTNNLMKHNAYGIFGSGQSYGNVTLNHYAPGAIVRRNVLATNNSIASRYPADNFFPSVATFMATFVNPSAADYRLVSGSPYIGAGTDGTDIGRRFPH
jgi:hypothetical protein